MDDSNETHQGLAGGQTVELGRGDDGARNPDAFDDPRGSADEESDEQRRARRAELLASRRQRREQHRAARDRELARRRRERELVRARRKTKRRKPSEQTTASSLGVGAVQAVRQRPFNSIPEAESASPPLPDWRGTLRVGDIVRAAVPFTRRPAPGKDGPRHLHRPAVVVAVLADSVDIRAVQDAGGALKRNGFGRTIRDWKEAGLKKPSRLATLVLPLRSDMVKGRIGRLSPLDTERLLSESTRPDCLDA